MVSQVNAFMPMVFGDTFISVKDVDVIIPYHEPLLE